MPIPTQSEIGLPLLELLSNGKTLHYDQIEKNLSKIFELSNEEKDSKKSSGYEGLLHNRIRWTVFYLEKADLVSRPKRGYVKISDEGKKILESKPEKINYSFLNKIPKFALWDKSKK